jgi:hypothetical protein
MSKEQPTPEAFEKLLRWLNPDRDKAIQKYEQIRVRLIRIFTSRGCTEAESLADETFDVVTSKIDWLIENYDDSDRALYFYAVGRNILSEYFKRIKKIPPAPPPPGREEIELKCRCLEECLGREVSPEDQILVLRYFARDKQDKIMERKKIAEEKGISLNALRIKVFHIISRLRPCVKECVERFSA